ncbi:MAG: iron-sulfur cluster assembly scaffold protein [Neomegalonema sp.]|nr:iron-sulfur cluster assembly scaffold protein [Neomegalonema sp.]
MADGDLIKLYSQRILALAADIPHAERLAAPQASASRRSPLCGSMVIVDAEMKDGRLTDLGMDVKACALGQASAAILGRTAIGQTREAIKTARDALEALLKENAAAPSGHFAELEVLAPARDYRNRHASIMLAWEGLLEAMAQAETVVAEA